MYQLDFNSLVSSFPFPQTEREVVEELKRNGSQPHAIDSQPTIARPAHHLSDAELFARILNVPIAIAEKVLAEGNGDLKYMAGCSKSAFEKSVGSEEAERLTAAFELGKRMARAHAEKSKSPRPQILLICSCPAFAIFKMKSLSFCVLIRKGRSPAKGSKANTPANSNGANLSAKALSFQAR